MSELPSVRQLLDKLRFMSVDQGHGTEPSSGLKDVGYPPGTIPAAGEHDWEFWQLYLAIVALAGQTPRLFDSLASALDLVGAAPPLVPIVDGDRFVVETLDGAERRFLGETAQTTIATGTVLAAATDGQREFWAVGTDVFARAGVGGAGPGWGPISPGGGTPLHLDTDGRFLYVGIVGGFVILDPVTGAVVTLPAVVGLPDDPTDLDANGEKLVIAMAGATDGLRQIGALGATPVIDGNFPTHGGNVFACAIDQNQAYYGGVGVGVDFLQLRAVQLGVFGGFLWSRSLSSGIPAGSVVRIRTDGAFVYVATLAAGGPDQTVWCLRREDGETVWSSAIPDIAGANELALDDRYLWVSGASTLDCYVLERATGARVATVSNFVARDADGFVALGTEATKLHSLYKADTKADFAKAVTTDVNRRPLYGLAAPIEDRELGARRLVFGSRKENSESTVLASAGTAGVPVAQHNFTPGVALEAGLYLVFFQANSTTTAGTTEGGVRFRVSAPGPVTLWPADHSYMRNTALASTKYIMAARFLVLSGSPTFGVDAVKVGGGGAADVTESIIGVLRWL